LIVTKRKTIIKLMDKTDTKQTGLTRDEKGRITGGTPPAGFNVHPENRSDGGWDKTMVFSYQYKRFMSMSLNELNEWRILPDMEKKVVEELAYNAVMRSKASLNDVKEITDRTEGKAPQSIDLSSKDGSMTPTVIIESVYANKPNFRATNTPAQADDVAEDSSS
jgi:hypothetical protein